MIQFTSHSLSGLEKRIKQFWALSGVKILQIEATSNSAGGSPVFTKNGVYTARGWTDWTQGFQYGSALLQFDATNDAEFLHIGRNQTVATMTPHVTHFGVHDHGFNNVSTYGNLLRLMNEGRIKEEQWERRYYELALKCSGAVQARRWTTLNNGEGYIYSFNGPHSLFIDTVRSLRSLAVAYRLRHVVKAENDQEISLLERIWTHLKTTAKYAVYYGAGRDAYDINGRVAHESIFNLNDGNYRCPNSQQGFSPFTTWTRGLAWAMLGFAEELEFFATLRDDELEPFGSRTVIEGCLLKAAQATCDFYIEQTPIDGIPYWDTGAPLLHKLGDYLNASADPFNPYEPVDSSAAAIAAQGLLRLGRYLQERGHVEQGERYWQAGITVVSTLLSAPYLCADEAHQGLILHAVYHRPNGWDAIPDGQQTPCGEATMWGDYHAREAVLYLQRVMRQQPYLTFWGN
ncbi:glycosyl hydrolase family protein [Candidatus Moduliflexus flocculans]|uniref:Glycosyl hydrolase family protein n=1 Tax=Candidatus Moduliflexus flocculans TaxID=1499966 RepID=A0A0S6W0N2_9BACT|nr:glycosyl hydrolase family protein [Candidatus Moduliflexus flocculans]